MIAIALGAGVALSAPAAAQLLVVSQDNAKVLEYDEGALFPGPCRIDPDFAIPDMDGRVPPR